ncbi:enhancer of polycomb 1-like [Crotalus adamanteus]|uniref:Enhancer of polycomb 1-like n=1 Tax=Crotalus adamanteus TaxID=8729 RepID=A0AAW1B179_CROAD
MGFKMKDDVVLGIGVNGILQASGLYKGLHFSSTMPTALGTQEASQQVEEAAQGGVEAPEPAVVVQEEQPVVRPKIIPSKAPLGGVEKDPTPIAHKECQATGQLHVQHQAHETLCHLEGLLHRRKVRNSQRQRGSSYISGCNKDHQR